jgi:hypothetical protein
MISKYYSVDKKLMTPEQKNLANVEPGQNHFKQIKLTALLEIIKVMFKFKNIVENPKGKKALFKIDMSFEDALKGAVKSNVEGV